MSSAKKQFTGAFKAQVVLEAIKGVRTVNEIAGAYEVHPTQIAAWKKHALAALPELLSDKRKRAAERDGEALVAQLYRQIGQLTVEVDFLKKKSALLG